MESHATEITHFFFGQPFRSTFRIRRRRSELSSKLLSVVLMKDSVHHAKAIGLTIPDSILVLADEVID